MENKIFSPCIFRKAAVYQIHFNALWLKKKKNSTQLQWNVNDLRAASNEEQPVQTVLKRDGESRCSVTKEISFIVSLSERPSGRSEIQNTKRERERATMWRRAEAGQRQKKQGKLTTACLTSIQELAFIIGPRSLDTYLVLQTVGGTEREERLWLVRQKTQQLTSK